MDRFRGDLVLIDSNRGGEEGAGGGGGSGFGAPRQERPRGGGGGSAPSWEPAKGGDLDDEIPF